MNIPLCTLFFIPVFALICDNTYRHCFCYMFTVHVAMVIMTIAPCSDSVKKAL